MSRGYRLFFVTVAGFLAAAGAFGFWLQPERPQLANEQGFEKISKSYRAGGSGCDPAKIRSLAIGLRQTKTDACAEAEEQHREGANNVVEARNAAIAANAQAVFAYQQTRIATWGGIIGGLTLIAAIGAAIFAERAAHHTGRSADMAHQGIRPWLLFDGIEIKPSDSVVGTWMIAPNFRNFGPSPAINVRLQTSHLIQSTRHPANFEPLPENDGHGTDVGQSQTITSGFWPLSYEQAFKKWTFIHCRFRYIDPITGKDYCSEIRIVFKGIWSDDSYAAHWEFINAKNGS